MKCYFVRHGIAEEQAPGGTDARRRLTREGIEKMRREAERLAQLDLRVDRIVSSPLVRARQTAEILAEALGLTKRLGEDPLLGHGFDLRALATMLAANDDSDVLMLVGHEPGMSATIEALTGARIALKKGGVACVDVTSRLKPAGILRWLAHPALLI